MVNETLKIVPRKIITLDVTTSLDIPSERVLRAALDRNLQGVVILGKEQDGNYYFASSISNGGEVLWMWEKLKGQLLVGSED
ncbi:MAG: hypothetical protein JZU65_05565 [Chlorobium sp.]|nr:hypothetical protein [Chlorobium sp.]